MLDYKKSAPCFEELCLILFSELIILDEDTLFDYLAPHSFQSKYANETRNIGKI